MARRRNAQAKSRNTKTKTPLTKRAQRIVAPKKKVKKAKAPSKRTASAYALMLANPCNAHLVGGQYGTSEGFLSKVRSMLTLPATATNTDTCGAFLWSPSYHNNAVNNAPMNCFLFRAASSATQMVNTALDPFGSALTTTQERVAGYKDPAYDFVNSALCRDARVLSSCLRLTYTGTMSTLSGQLCVVQGLPLTSLLTDLPSVDSLFVLNADKGSVFHRMPLDTTEAVWKPQDPEAALVRFKDTADGPVTNVNPGPSVISAEALAFEPVFYGFAWRGLTAGASISLVFDFIKNIEWRPAPAQGFVQAPAILLGPPVIHAAARQAEQIGGKSTWAHTINSTVSDVTAVAQAAQAGVKPMTEAYNVFKDIILPIGAGLLSFL